MTTRANLLAYRLGMTLTQLQVVQHLRWRMPRLLGPVRVRHCYLELARMLKLDAHVVDSALAILMRYLEVTLTREHYTSDGIPTPTVSTHELVDTVLYDTKLVMQSVKGSYFGWFTLGCKLAAGELLPIPRSVGRRSLWLDGFSEEHELADSEQSVPPPQTAPTFPETWKPNGSDVSQLLTQLQITKSKLSIAEPSTTEDQFFAELPRSMVMHWLPLENGIQRLIAPIAVNGGLLTRLQVQIMDALDGKAHKKAQLGASLKIETGRLYKPGGIKELQAEGLVLNQPSIGYYRPDAPPPDLKRSAKKRCRGKSTTKTPPTSSQ